MPWGQQKIFYKVVKPLSCRSNQLSVQNYRIKSHCMITTRLQGSCLFRILTHTFSREQIPYRACACALGLLWHIIWAICYCTCFFSFEQLRHRHSCWGYGGARLFSRASIRSIRIMDNICFPYLPFIPPTPISLLHFPVPLLLVPSLPLFFVSFFSSHPNPFPKFS